MIVWWIKKDFRLSDNPALVKALEKACATGEQLLALFILEPSAMAAAETSQRHVESQLAALRGLRAMLSRSGGDCLAVEGEVVELLERIHEVDPITTLVSHEEIGLWRTYQRDLAVGCWCRKVDIDWIELPQTGVFRRLADRDQRSARWKAWMSDGPLAAPEPCELSRCMIPSGIRQLWHVSDQVLARRIERPRWSVDTTTRKLQRVSETDAHRVLGDFLNRRSVEYSGGISSPNSAFRAGSRLSVHLAWGTITGREVYARTRARLDELSGPTDDVSKQWRKSLRAFLGRLHWRDHFIQRLETEPQMEFTALNRAYDQLEFTSDPARLAAWESGTTGYPMVDACLRCARTTGFLNFRMRCLITSFACHCLHIDWRDILWPMARWWTDYEPGIHVAQLQMQAGVVGINTLRVYSPVKQMIDHDPAGVFVRRWVPELRSASTDGIVSHPVEPIDGYPPALVDWRESSAMMKQQYYALRRLPETRALAKVVLDTHGSRRPARAKRKISKEAAGGH